MTEFEDLRAQAKAGDIEAQDTLGVCYRKGRGSRRTTLKLDSQDGGGGVNHISLVSR
jgi:hypothetical protein